jgi:hypothetical protein
MGTQKGNGGTLRAAQGLAQRKRDGAVPVELELACRQQQVGEGHFPSLAAVPTTAFTVTIPAILAAKTLLRK